MRCELKLNPIPTPLLGFTPLANHVNTITKKSMCREGVHLFQGVEIASVYDLVVMCQKTAQRLADSYQANTIRNWIKVFEWAVEAEARAVVCKRRLETDQGIVEVGKRRRRRSRPTYFIAIEDFPIYLEAVRSRHPVVGKRLQLAWAMIRDAAEYRSQTAFNF